MQRSLADIGTVDDLRRAQDTGVACSICGIGEKTNAQRARALGEVDR